MTDPEPTPWTPQLVRVMVGLVLALFLVATNATIVATAIPTIAVDLDGLSLYPWIVGAYLLTSTTTVPLWGRLADLHGRRTTILFGTGIFVAASLLCAISQDAVQLVAARTLQGVGSGAVATLVFTIISDLFSRGQRGRVQGVLSSVWAVSSVLGPLAGASLVSTAGWRWIFAIDIPLGVVALILLAGYREARILRNAGDRLDLRGVILLPIAIAVLLYGLGTGTSDGRAFWPAIVAGVVLVGTFLFFERRSAHPTIPFDLVRDVVIGPITLITALSGAIMFVALTYVPLYVQQVLRLDAFAAGAAVTSMFLMWPIAATISGALLERVRTRWFLLAGGSLQVPAALALTLAPSGGIVLMCAACGLLGFGLGLFTAPLLIAAQDRVAAGQRGVVTALNTFARSIGGVFAVALAGALVLSASGESGPGTEPELAAGLHAVFTVVVVLAIAILGLAIAALVRLARPGWARRDDPAEDAT